MSSYRPRSTDGAREGAQSFRRKQHEEEAGSKEEAMGGDRIERDGKSGSGERSLGEAVLHLERSFSLSTGCPTFFFVFPKSANGASSLVSDVPGAGFHFSSLTSFGSIVFPSQYPVTSEVTIWNFAVALV